MAKQGINVGGKPKTTGLLQNTCISYLVCYDQAAKLTGAIEVRDTT